MDLKEVIVVDINSIPRGLDIDVWIRLIEVQGVLLWDSMCHPEEGHIAIEPKPFSSEHSYRLVDIRQLSPDERDELFKSLNIEP
jgi:hypothetical protein